MKKEYQFCWRTGTAEFTEVHPARRSYRDPTADEAIRNVMREECRKKKRTQQKGCHPAGQGQESGGQRKEKMPCGKMK